MKKILAIEDDAKIAAALRVRLTAAGYEVFTAGDGFTGLKMTMTHAPDLILLDIMMPVGMGFSVAERLRDLGLGEIPIIFITASKRAGLRKTAQQLGAAGFFEKPYDAEELLSAVKLILNESAVAAPIPPPPAPVSPMELRKQA
ncbi:MAG TPA: response regulator transcription factor [Verrucomicrobiae bacterium]|nr:response regulator transcription factor [Verrucomicrobiae bacterium]